MPLSGVSFLLLRNGSAKPLNGQNEGCIPFQFPANLGHHPSRHSGASPPILLFNVLHCPCSNAYILTQQSVLTSCTCSGVPHLMFKSAGLATSIAKHFAREIA